MRYYYLKTINNNAIVCKDENNHEAIILGKGLGVDPARYLGKEIDPNMIERVFTNNNEYIEPLLRDIPYSYYELVQWILEYASHEFQYDFKDSLFLTLLDHIVFAKNRDEEGDIIINPLLNEIKTFEREKYEFSEIIVNEINKRLETNLDENEVGYLAFHFVNAMSDLSQSKNKKIVTTLKQLTEYLSNMKDITIDYDSYNFARMIMHFKYLLARALSNKRKEEGGVDEKFISMIKESYSEEWKRSLEICAYLENAHNIITSEQEVLYMTMHILPIFNKSKGK